MAVARRWVFCAHCGQTLDMPEWKYCPACGTAIGVIVSESAGCESDERDYPLRYRPAADGLLR